MMFQNTIKYFSTHDPKYEVIEVVLNASWRLCGNFLDKVKGTLTIKYILFLTKRIEK